MVFESIVVDILNKFLGNYVENLDSSQLKIGIWGGDVSLKNLSLKPSALDELDLPVKTIYGHLGKLILKIPWKNIYTAPVEVSVENLFLLVNPIQDVVYDPVKEEKFKQEAKQAIINQIELAKKVEREKDGNKVDDTFVEKLAAQIIKNVQIFIQNIHIRYEDRVTKPERPFSIGIFLHTLKVFTTNESCDRYILPQETSPIFYKIMKMEGLALYWNTNQKYFISAEEKDASRLESFVDSVASKGEMLNYNYILGPISAEAKLQINSKPEMINFLTPKMYLSLVLDQLLVQLSRSQYQDFIALLETFDRMSKAALYRKYRPKLNQYRGHYKEWWQFAITCVLEEEIKRKSRNWDWSILRAHRELIKKYQIVYRAKLTEKPNDTTQRELTNIENQLDAFNIILMRQKVENEVEREGRLTAQQKSKKGGWFSGWFSSSKTQPDENEDAGNDIVKKIENAMTDEEKAKLYWAIDYTENSMPAMYPKSFIATRLEFILKVFRILVTDDYVSVSENKAAVCPVLCIEFKDAFVSLHQRPGAQSFAIAIKMQTFQTLGLSQNDIVPQIIKSKLSVMKEQSDVFLNIYFETNPDDENYDQRLHVTLRPLKVVYDAQTVIRVLEVFTPEKDISNVKDQLQAAANTKLEEMKEKSTIRLQYAIEKSTRLDLKIDLMAPYLILPHGGLYTKNERALILNLGRITVSSVDKSEKSYNVKRMLSSGKNEDEVVQQLMRSCYDHFNISLSQVQILSLNAGESWRPKLEDTVIVDVYSDAHILQPTSLHIDIYKCLLDDDPRLPKMKIDGDLPDITVRITDQKLLEVVSLLLSVPLPKHSSPLVEEIQPEIKDDLDSSIYDSAMSLRQKLENVNKMPFSTLRKYNRQNEASAEHTGNDDSKLLIDYINLEANFRLKTVTLYVVNDGSDVPVIEASVFGLELTFKQKQYSSEIFSKLGKISLTQGYQNTSIPAINTPLTTKDEEQYLFCCKLLIVDKSSPLFAEFYDSTAISMSLDFTKLYIVAHQEAILNTIEWMNNLQNKVLSLISEGSNVLQTNENKPKTIKRRKTSLASNVSAHDTHRKKLKPKSKLAAIVEDHLSETNTSEERKRAVLTKETVELKISVQLNVIQMCIQTASRPVASMDIDGFQAALSLKKSCTNINFILQSISVCDLNPDTIYHKVAYISEGKNAFQAIVTLNNDIKEECTQTENFDVLVQVRVNCLQCVFINEFVVNLLEFSNNFQTSKQILADASAAAVASAKMNMQQVYQSSTRLSLDVFAEAPVIVVPRNNQSDEIFVIDFGNLSVKNSLKSLACDLSGHTPLIDEIFTSLEDMKIVRTNFARTQIESVLLKPVNYTLIVKRNLSSSWYHEVPDFDIDGVFHSIHIEVTDRDYKLLMQTLNENIAAKQSMNASKSASPAAAGEILKSDVEIDSHEKEIEQKETVEVHLETYDEVIRMMMRFSMAIESVTIDLFSGLKDTNENDGLAKFTLALLSVKGSILTNGDMSIHAFLSDCCLDDTRSSKITNEVKQYMKRKSAEEISCNNFSSQFRTSMHHDSSSSLDVSLPSTSYESSSRSMIDVTIQKKLNRTDVNARVFSFILIFNVDYLMRIKDFFLSELTSPSVQASPNTSDFNKKSVSMTNAPENLKNHSVMDASVTYCNIVIEKPDIILVENLDDINANAIILNNEAILKIQLADDGRLALNGSLKNLQLYSSCYNPQLRNQTTSLILHPLTVDLAGSTDDDKCLHLDVNVSELMISVTAGTIELLTKISTTLIPNVQNESSILDISQNDYSNIWQPNSIDDDYWFLRAEKGIDAMTLCSDSAVKSNNADLNRKDVILIAVPTVGITFEAGVGKKTMPVLALKSSFFGTVQKDLVLMNIESYVTLEIAYYNTRLALWEPVIEPVATAHTGSGISSYSPWKLEMSIQMLNKENEDIAQDVYNPVEDVPDKSPTSNSDTVSSPAFSLMIKSNERMEITITKTCMDVIRRLTQSFNNAVYLKSSNLNALNEAGFSSYKFINDFGVEVEVNLKADKHLQNEGDTSESMSADLCQKVAVNSGEDVTLFVKREGSETRRIGETDNLCLFDKLNMITDKKKFFFDIHILERNKNLLLPISRADKRYFAIRGQGSASNGNGVDSWGLISEVEINDGSVITTLRSVVQIHNHFNVDITVYYLKNDQLCDAGVVGPFQHLNLPVYAVYGSKSQLFFAPERFSVSSKPFVWRDIEKNISLSKQLQCQAKNSENEDPFFIRALGEMEQVYYENTSSYTIASTSYVIHLRPTLILKNFLPVNIVCCLQGIGTEYTLKPGERMNVSSAEPNHSTIVLRLDDYLDKVWSCKKVVKTDSPVFSIWTFTSYDSETPFSLNLGVWYSNSNESMIFALYCPFWMVNKTGLNLSYKGVEDGGMILHHPKDFDEPILFSFKEKSFFSKKKACVRVNNGNWSDKFSVDAAGSSGAVTCHHNNTSFPLGVYIMLNSNSLTKQVIFSPFYSLTNSCTYAIEFRENQAENVQWITIEPDICIPFWPTVQDDKLKTLELRISGTSEITASFSYLKIKTYSLMLPNKYGGLQVDVQVNEGGVYVAVSPFNSKMATALVINSTNSTVEFSEADLGDVKNRSHNTILQRQPSTNVFRKWQLDANKEVFFNWSSTFCEKPILLINTSSDPIDLRKDGVGKYSSNEEGESNFWISFLHGMQRILLITPNESLVKKIEAIGDLNSAKQDISLSLEGIGFSLVNNVAKQELLYLSISSSGVLWETQEKPGKRYKPVKDHLNECLEQLYTSYCNMIATTNNSADINQEIDTGKGVKVVVNFYKNMIIHPNSLKLRRTYCSGLWFQIKSSEHYKQIHAKIHRLQVDNQIYDCVFPVIFFPVPPPKSVAIDDSCSSGVEKPFAELSVVQRINEHSNINQFKYFKVLIQEFHVKADIGLINCLVKFFEADNITDEEELALFQKDQEMIKEPLCIHVSSVTSQDFFDSVHFTPLKIHISFSLSGDNPNSGTPQEGLPIVNLLTQSVGVTLTDVNDVVFKLAYFERKHKFYSHSQLVSEVKTHYIGQFVKQLYVLVLGLDVLGNPFGLVTGFKQGVEDFFYEPFQGAIQGPSEFAEGLLLGVRSLFGHTVGGAAGAVGRITGAMGKGIAALTLDEEYQKKRRQRLAHNQRSIKEGGRGLVMGVVEGVGGVISKPISGAKEEGVEGFVKGVGKGVVGFFTRPVSGVADFASGTFDVVRRATSFSEEVQRYRLPRFIKENGLVVPYSEKYAQGYKLLLDLDKGKYSKTDYYVFHLHMSNGDKSDKEILLLTNNRILYIFKPNDIFCENIRVEWQYTWQEINIDNGIGETDSGIFIKPQNDSRRPSSLKSLFGHPSKGKILLIRDPNLRKWLLDKMKNLIQKPSH